MSKKSSISKKASKARKRLSAKTTAKSTSKKSAASKNTSSKSSRSKADKKIAKVSLTSGLNEGTPVERVKKLFENIASRRRAKKHAAAKKKAEYLASLPKSRIKRFFYRFHPKRMFNYWFSKQGGLMALKLTGVGFALFVIVVLGTFAYFRRDLPDPRDISSRSLNQTTKFYDRTGEHLLYEVYGDQNRTLVEFDQISDYAKFATVAIEDKDFYQHSGFSVTGIGRAVYNNVFSSDDGTQGGSTITQQFIKNSLLTSEQRITRKIKELILSIELERLYTKDEILSFYLNEIPYGSQEYGIEAAAQSFFRKSAAELSIDEAAMLASLPQAPTTYSPYGENTDILRERQISTIGAMAVQGYITQEEADAAIEIDTLAKVTPAEQRSLYTNITAPHFVLEVQKQLEEEFGPALVQTGGLSVITTLDYDLQKIADETVANNIEAVTNPASGGGSGDNTALVSVDNETGQIVAMVGSRDFNYPEYGAFNAATSGRQPGSSFKPFGYAEQFKSERWGPDSIIYDTNTSFSEYKPNNFDFRFRGAMTVREALGESRNIPAVKALYIGGVENTVNLARAMGNTQLGDASNFGLSLVLGAGEVRLDEHTNAYSTFARGGVAKPTEYILKVSNADGDVLSEWKDNGGTQVLDEEIAFLISDALSDDAARAGTFGRGNPRLVVPGLRHTVKTGTTDESRDGWMMGYSRQLSTGVWAGNHDNTPMNTITSWQTGPIFTEFMRRAHFEVLFDQRSQSEQPLFDSVPNGIQTILMDRDTGYAATEDSKNTYTGLFPSWHVKQEQADGSKVVIDTISNKLATQCTPERAKDEIASSNKWPELLPDDVFFDSWAKSAGYGSASQTITENDDVHDCSDVKPTVNLTATKLADGIYEFTADVTKGTHAMDALNFKINDQIVSAVSVSASGSFTYTHQFTTPGSFTVAAEVVDSVLYDDTDTANITVTDVYSGSGLELTDPLDAAVFSGDFIWSSDADATHYQVCWQQTSNGGGSLLCIATVAPDTDYTPGAGIDSGEEYSAYVESWLGEPGSGLRLQQSSAVSFTAP